MGDRGKRDNGRVIASLPMYDRLELTEAHRRFWELIRRELEALGVAGPASLSRGVSDLLGHWRSPDLVLSQTCGMPYRLELRDAVTLVGTPDYGVEGCPPGYYRSLFVARTSDERSSLEEFASGTFAFNETMSQSGYNAAKTHVHAMGFWFAQERQTGGHVASAHAVARGSADIAAIDAVTWRLMQRHDPVVSALRVVDATTPTPGLPYITSVRSDAHVIFAAVTQAIAGLSSQDRDALGILGLVTIPDEDYLAIPTSAG